MNIAFGKMHEISPDNYPPVSWCNGSCSLSLADLVLIFKSTRINVGFHFIRHESRIREL